MKKVISLMLLFATMLTFTACGGDDEPDNTKFYYFSSFFCRGGDSDCD